MQEADDSVTGSIARKQIAFVFVAITAASVAISRLGAAPPLDEYVHVSVALLFLWTALHLAEKDARGPEWFGLDLGGWLSPPREGAARSLVDDLRRSIPLVLRELGVALALSALIFPPFALAFSVWHAPTRDLALSLPPNLINAALSQVLVVALPEEALFRGYFQTRLADILPPSLSLGTKCLPWLAIVMQATLFALLHFAVDLDVTRLSVFFPGLLFGAIRTLRGGIGAAVFFHALCNLYSDVLVRGWL